MTPIVIIKGVIIYFLTFMELLILNKEHVY